MKGIPEPTLAVRRLASLVVQRHDLHPPVQIEDLLREYADLRYVDWSLDKVDALAHGLASDRPKVLVRASQPRLRRRFTLGHELGHILISWHQETVTCLPEYEVDLPPHANQERQADIFASGILLPDRWLGKLIVEHSDDMDSILASLQEAEVSAIAALLGLRRNLFSGWAFILEANGSQLIKTPGTSASWDGSGFDERVHAEGQAQLQGRVVRWYRLRDVGAMPEGFNSSDDPTRVLRAALSKYSPLPETRMHLEPIVNGKIGGILREGARGRSIQELYSTLEYRFQNCEYSDLLACPEFRIWLLHKAVAVASGSTRRYGVKRLR